MIYLQLFLSFLQIGMFSFGGGYAAHGNGKEIRVRQSFFIIPE